MPWISNDKLKRLKERLTDEGKYIRTQETLEEQNKSKECPHVYGNWSQTEKLADSDYEYIQLRTCVICNKAEAHYL